MTIIRPRVKFFGAVPTEYNASLKFIEMAGRTCYKSEDKITKDSAEGFVRKLIKAGHLAMVEHSNFVVKTHKTVFLKKQSLQGMIGKYLNVLEDTDFIYVGGSLTAWYQSLIFRKTYEGIFNDFFHNLGMVFGMDEVEFSHSFFNPDYSNDWISCSHNEIPKELHRYSAKFICDRGVSHELVRHRPCSFAQESTRYVNYSGKDMEFIEPTEYGDWPIYARETFLETCVKCSQAYQKLLFHDLKPQQARAVLPNALKTEIVVTADAAEWTHIRKLRTAKSAHPDMQRVMNMVPWESFL